MRRGSCVVVVGVREDLRQKNNSKNGKVYKMQVLTIDLLTKRQEVEVAELKSEHD